MASSHGVERRRYFRLRYPASKAPIVEIMGDEYTLIESSEGGIVFNSRNSIPYAIGQFLPCKITFHDGEVCYVNGRILRIMPGSQVVVQLTRQIPQQRMVLEQQYVLRLRREGIK